MHHLVDVCKRRTSNSKSNGAESNIIYKQVERRRAVPFDLLQPIVCLPNDFVDTPDWRALPVRLIAAAERHCCREEPAVIALIKPPRGIFCDGHQRCAGGEEHLLMRDSSIPVQIGFLY